MCASFRRIAQSFVLSCLVLLMACGNFASVAQTADSDTAAGARDRGAEAFKEGRYGDAIAAFKKALVLDPNLCAVRLYLGTTYAAQMVPNLQTPENQAFAKDAIAALTQIPESDPAYPLALKQLAAVYRNIVRLDEARQTELAVLKLTPNDAESNYAVGMIDWMQAYKFSVDALRWDGLQGDDGVGNSRMSAATCDAIRTHNAPLMEDAVTHLTRALELNPTYADAMAYLNLVYRRRADFDCSDPVARAEDIAVADKWSKLAAQSRGKTTPSAVPR
jgi:tetratricopeptide (TPR) repeat protein